MVNMSEIETSLDKAKQSREKAGNEAVDRSVPGNKTPRVLFASSEDHDEILDIKPELDVSIVQ